MVSALQGVKKSEMPVKSRTTNKKINTAFNKNMNADKCPHCGSPRTSPLSAYWTCKADTTQRDEDGRTHLCREREAHNKTKWENVKLRELLHCAADDLQHWDETVRAKAQRELYEFLEKGAALAHAPEEPTIKESLTVQPAPEWRELGEDEIIGADDEYNPASLGDWIKVPHGWIGEKCDITKVRTRRPLPTSPDNEVARLREENANLKETLNQINKIRYEIQKLKNL
jgi:hypothetical protein